MEIIIDKAGVMELVTSMDVLNNLRDGEIQRIRLRFLLPERNLVNYNYYLNMGLEEKITKLNMSTILKLFKNGSNFGKYGLDATMGTPAVQRSPRWKKYGYRFSDTYLHQIQTWLSNRLDPQQDMELIVF